MNLAAAASLTSSPRSARRRSVLLLLVRILADLRDNPVARRALRMRPAAALESYRLDGGLATGELPVSPMAADLVLTPLHLFGATAEPAAGPLPVELRLIGYGVKPAALIQGREAELVPLLAAAEARGWTAILSPHEWAAVADQGKAGYANLADDPRPARPGSGAFRSLIVSPDRDRAVQAWLALAFGWDAYLGALLGYPSCCSASFAARWPTAIEAHQGDISPLVLDASGPGPHDWRANILARYFGAALVQHFPCRFDCHATIALGARVAAAMALYEPAALASARLLLASPALYSEHHGIVILPDARPERDGDGIRLDLDPGGERVATEPAGRLARAVADAVEIVWDGERIHTGDAMLDARLAWFADQEAVREKGGGDAIPELARA